MVSISTSLPATGLVMPSSDDLRHLRSIVLSQHPWLVDGGDRRSEAALEAEFRSAFWAAGLFYRTDAPNRTQYFAHWLDIANSRLASAGSVAVEGNALLCACLAHGDIVWRRPSPAGELLEFGVDEHRGKPCANAWRDVLAGAPLRPPVSTKVRPQDAPGIPRPSVSQKLATGEMRKLSDSESMW